MYIQSLELIHEMLSDRLEGLNEQYTEIADCIDAYCKAPQESRDDANNAVAFEELKKRFANVDAERGLVAQVKADFERTNWH